MMAGAGADKVEADRLRRAAADSSAWALFAPDKATALELDAAAYAARIAADDLEGFLPLGIA